MKRAHYHLSLAGILASAILVGCGGGGGGGLSDPGLSNVQVEVSNARSAVITPDGGTITATGSNGVVYTLTLPEGAVQKDTQIAVYPLQSLKNLPAGATVTAGANFAPEGLQLSAPATLTMQFPATIDPKRLVGFAYSGNGLDERLFPAAVTGQKVTMSVEHFSGVGVGGQDLANLLLDPVTFTASHDFQVKMERARIDSQLSTPPTDPGPAYARILHDWYSLTVQPALDRGGQPNAPIGDIADAEQEYDAWLDAVSYATETSLDVNIAGAELTDSKPRAVFVLLVHYKFFNQRCENNANGSLDPSSTSDSSPLYNAALALAVGTTAHRWGIDTAANSLDNEFLLNNLCVKVVIDPSRSFSGTKPGETGTLSAKAGISIAGNPVRHDVRVRLNISGSGLFPGPSSGLTNAQGNFLSTIPWPAGVNTIRIDMLANVESPNALIQKIRVFDRITKTATDDGGGGGGGSGIFGRYDGTFTDRSSGSSGGSGPARIFLTGQGNLVGVEIQQGNVGSPKGPQFKATLTGSTLHFEDGDTVFDATITGTHMSATEHDPAGFTNPDRFDYEVDKAGT